MFAVLKDDDVGVVDEEEEGRSADKREFRGMSKRLCLCFKRASNPFQLGLSVRAIGLDKHGGDS